MNRINRVIVMVIAMVVIMISAVVIDKGYTRYEAKQWEKERVSRYQEAYDQAADIQLMIRQLSEDEKALNDFIEENASYFDSEEWGTDGIYGQEEGNVSGNSVSENEMQETEETASGNGFSEDAVSGNFTSDDTISDNTVSQNRVSGNDISGNTADGDVSGGSLSVSDNTISGNTISGNSIPKYSLSESLLPGIDLTLYERRKIGASYQTTLSINRLDEKLIEENTIDFSDMSITCLGDSITAASNLDSIKNFEEYSYPEKLKNILNAESVDNLGIGGSSIGRYWDKPFVERYKEIPEDTDLIIVMGGTNDGFCVTQEELGTLQERKERTFTGDLDELMRGLIKNYPNASIVFATPLPNILHDMLRKDRENLLPQSALVKIIKELAAEYGIPVIDLYNSNLLDTHDAAVIHNFMPDGVHGNEQGYQVLAEHFAAKIMQMYEDGTLKKKGV